MRHTRNRRLAAGMIALTVLLAVLSLRLAWLQLAAKNRPVPGGRHSLAQMARLQSERDLVLDSGRGRLLDRYGRPLAGKTVLAAAMFPQAEGAADAPGAEERLARLAAVLGASPEELRSRLKAVHQPEVWQAPGGSGPLALTPQQARRIEEIGVDGVRVLPVVRRYAASESGRQWIGYLSESVDETAGEWRTGRPEGRTRADEIPHLRMSGTAGLEKTLEPLLRGAGPTEASVQVDARGARLTEKALRVNAPHNPYYPLSVYTTIDRDIQEAAEQLAKEEGIREGAVVVLDAATGDIEAMVSLPFYRPEEISPEGGEWNNRALQAAVPGSIFKIVTAAAALEMGVAVPDEQFQCTGEYGKYHLSCSAREGHGTLTFAQGFAESCNTVFAALAERLTADQLRRTADALGLGRTVGWSAPGRLGLPLLRPLAREERGTVFDPRVLAEDEPGARVQTAIGQRDAAVTPLQAANLVVTLLHGGRVQSPRIVSRIDFANGQLLAGLEPRTAASPEGAISPRTASQLLAWMRGVVTDGTGRSLRSAKWPLAGKSGTAQTTVKGAPRNNQWFIGYGPADRPRYAVAVVAENVRPGGPHAATRLFGRIMDYLSEGDEGGIFGVRS